MANAVLLMASNGYKSERKSSEKSPCKSKAQLSSTCIIPQPRHEVLRCFLHVVRVRPVHDSGPSGKSVQNEDVERMTDMFRDRPQQRSRRRRSAPCRIREISRG